MSMTVKRSRAKSRSLEYSDPGKVLNLCMNLLDDACSLLQAKINVFLQEETESELAFHVVLNVGRGESYIEAAGSHVLQAKRKIYMPKMFTEVLKVNEVTSVLFASLDADLQKIVSPYLSKEEGSKPAKRRILVVPISRNPFSLLVFLVNTQMQDEDAAKLLFETYLFVWPVLQKCIAYEHERMLKQKCQQLLRVARRLFTQVGSLETLLQLVMTEARRLARAEACSVLLIDPDRMQLVESYFHTAANAESEAEKSDRRFPLDAGLTGRVIKSGEVVNVKQPRDSPQFLASIDERPGLTTRSLLCFPIREQSGIIGVGQLFNKIDEPFFDVCDEEMALAFSTYCGICIVHSMVYKKIEESHVRSALANELMMYHMKVSNAEVSRVEDCGARHAHPHIASLHLNARVLPPRELPCYVVHMFQHLGFLKTFNIKRPVLIRFVLYVQKGYRDVPYHNWYHAFSVTQFAYAAILHWKLMQQGYLSDLQCLMYLLAGLVHDLDHRGTTNSFQVAGETTLAALYSSEGSVMERHHLAQAMCILNTDGCDILSALPRRDYDRALLLLRDFVLSTDLANLFKKLPEYRQIGEDGYIKGNRVHSAALMSMLMNAADLCEQVKDWGCIKKTAAAVLTEFFQQGEMEKNRGDLPAAMMDQDKAFIPDLEIDFIHKTTIPLFEVLGLMIPTAGQAVKIMENHIERWEASRSIFAEVPTTAGLSVLLSAELDNLIELNLKERRERLLREREAAAAAAAGEEREQGNVTLE